MLNKAPRGTVDIYGEEMSIWNEVEKVIKEVTKNYNISEIRTPIFEYTELFIRGVGESSDIVNKEIYTFNDKKGRSLSLRPEGTAGVARAFIENKMYADTLPKKMYYLAPFFRYEKPQAGRQRQFHQLGVEYYGSDSVYSDVEVILLASELISKLGIKNVTLELNSLGDVECRKNFNQKLKNFLSETIDDLCDECKVRFQKNPMRVFDCKNDKCQEKLSDAPIITENLGENCKKEFEQLQELLKELGVPYVINKNLVRGLDYYTKTVFEFTCKDIGAKSTICGGGRYNNLIKEMSNIEVPAVGFGIGMERLILTIKSNKDSININKDTLVYIGSIGAKGKLKAMQLTNDLRNNNIKCEFDIADKNVKAQMKFANKINSDYSIIVGDNEVETGKFELKDMETGEKTEFKFEEIEKIIQNLKR